MQVEDSEYEAAMPIPQGVEVLFLSAEIDERIAYLRYEDKRPLDERMPELRRLVSEQSRRELSRLGVI